MKQPRTLNLFYLLMVLLLTATQSASAIAISPANLAAISDETIENGINYHWLKEYTGPKYWDAAPQNPLLVTHTEGNELIPGPHDSVRLIISLNAPSTAEYVLTLRADLPIREKQSLINAYTQSLDQQQTAFIEDLTTNNIIVTEVVRHKFLNNDITVLTEAANLLLLSKLRSVKQVSADY